MHCILRLPLSFLYPFILSLCFLHSFILVLAGNYPSCSRAHIHSKSNHSSRQRIHSLCLSSLQTRALARSLLSNMAPTKRKQALAESSDYTKKAKLMLIGGLEGIAGWFLKAPEIDQQRTLKQQRRGDWIGAYPTARDRREEYYIGGVAYSEEDLDHVDPYRPVKRPAIASPSSSLSSSTSSSSSKSATASASSMDQPSSPSLYPQHRPSLSHIDSESRPYQLQPYTKPPPVVAPDFGGSKAWSISSSGTSKNSSLNEILSRPYEHQGGIASRGFNTRYDQDVLLRARPRVYASKVQKSGSLLQSKYYNEDSITRQRTFERHSSENQKVIQGRLRAALNGTIGALRSENTKADRDASDDVTNAHRHIRAYNRGILDEDDSEQQRKPSLRLPAWTRTMYLGNREPTWLKNIRNVVNKSLPPSIENQNKLPGHQAVSDEHDRIEQELAAERHGGPVFTDEDEKRIRAVLAPGHGPVVDGFNMTLNKHDLLTLRPGEWLNDSVIDFYSQLIMDRSKKTPSLPRVHVFTTHFFSTLAEHGYNKIRRWTKKVDLFALDYVLVPVHCSGNHWTTAVIDMKRKKIEYLDSLMGNNPKCFVLLRGYLESEHKDKKKTPFDFTGWTDDSPKNIPKQRNGFDCGVFTSTFIERKSRGLEKFTFSQKDMEALRKHMVLSILNQSLDV